MDIPKNWTFENTNIAENFDSHVREQLPWYELATNAVAVIARQYIPHNGLVYDIGASTGNVGRALESTITDRNCDFVPIEESSEMASNYESIGKIVVADATRYDYAKYDVAICFLVLMFIPVNDREPFIRLLRGRIKKGGVLIVVDKCKPAGGYAGTAINRLTIAGKLSAGASPKDILDKELSLSGYQRPIDPAELEPNAVEFFRFGDFAGWLIE